MAAGSGAGNRRGRWRRGQRVALPGPGARHCLSRLWSPPMPPPLVAGAGPLPTPMLLPQRGVLGREVGQGRGGPHFPSALLWKLNRRWKASHPAPNPENPLGKLTRCVTPISMQCGEQAASSPPRPDTPRAPRAGLEGPRGRRARLVGRGSGTSEKPGRTVPESYHLPLKKVRGPLRVGAGGHSTLTLA